MLRPHTENQLSSLHGSALKVCVVGGGGGWWVVVVESEFSDRLWLSFSLALAKPNNFYPFILKLLLAPNKSIQKRKIKISRIFKFSQLRQRIF
jgi:hypothetical protein